MIVAADLLAAYNALDAEHPAYWFNELNVDSDGNLIHPSDATHYLLRLAADPANDDLDGEAYSRAVLTVQAWSTSRGGEWAVRDAAVTALTALNWERLSTNQIASDNTRFGLTTNFEATF